MSDFQERQWSHNAAYMNTAPPNSGPVIVRAPLRPIVLPAYFVALCMAIVEAGFILLVMRLGRRVTNDGACALGAILLGSLLLGTLAWILWRIGRVQAARCEATAESSSLPLVSELDHFVTRLNRPRNLSLLREALEQAGMHPSRRAHVVCMGPLDVPDANCPQFDATVVDPPRPRRSWHWYTPALLGSAVCWFVASGWLLGYDFNTTQYGVFTALPSSLLCGLSLYPVIALHVKAHPSVLAASGLIGIRHCGGARKQRGIRWYPMTGETLVVVCDTDEGVVFYFSRGANKDVLSLARFIDRKRVESILWAALLSPWREAALPREWQASRDEG